MVDDLVIATIQVLYERRNVHCCTTVITLTLLRCEPSQIPVDSFLYIPCGREPGDGLNWLVPIR